MIVEELRQLLHYDLQTGIFYWRVSRPNAPAGSKAGGRHSAGYWKLSLSEGKVLAHRLAWFYVHGEWPSGELDHINGDRLDNRIENLRIATTSQNQANRHATKSRTLPKGVRLRQDGRYTASIKKNYKHHFLGSFVTPEDAHAAYITASQNMFGEFARSA